VADGGKPSRDSMREVKREFKERQKAEQERMRAARDYWALETGRPAPVPKKSVLPAVLAVAGVAAVAVAAAFVLHLGPLASSSAATAPDGTGSTSTTATPTGATVTPTPIPSASDDGTDPTVVAVFQDSPAKSWPIGAAGVVPPKPRQVGVYRPVQVAAAYDVVIRYLRAAMLDHRVVYKGKLDTVLAATGTDTATWLKAQQKLGTKTKGAKGIHWDSVANRFHIGDWKAAAEIRAKGRMYATQVKDGTLEVHFVYVAAYWLVPAKGGAARTIAIRRSGSMLFAGNGPNRVTQPSFGGAGYTSSASVCGAAWPFPDFVEAWVDPGEAKVVSPSPADSPYDPTDINAPDATGCFTDTSGFAK